MSTNRLYHYSAIRYVPRPEAEEFVNVGVIAVSDEGDELSVEFTNDWTRARALGGSNQDILMLRRLARAWRDEQENAPLSDVLESGGRTWLERVYEQSANTVQLSTPRRALAADVDEVMDDLYESLIASASRHRTPRARTAPKQASIRRGRKGSSAGRKVGTQKRSGARRKR